MAIFFEPIEASVSEAEARGALRLTGFATDMTGEFAAASGALLLSGAARAVHRNVNVVINSPAVATGSLTLYAEAEGFDVVFESVYSSLTITGQALSLATDGSEGASTGALTLQGAAFASAGSEVVTTFMVDRPAIVYALPGSVVTAVVTDSLTLSSSATSVLDFIIESTMRMDDAPSLFMALAAEVTSSMQLRDSLAILLDMDLVSALNLDDPAEADLRLLVALTDYLQLADEPGASLSALQTVVSTLVLRDALAPVIDGLLESELVLTPELAARIDALVEAVSELALSDEASPSLHMFGLVEDTLQLTDDPSVLLAALAELTDTLRLFVHVDTGTTRFAGYAVNLRNAAVSEYENYDFNSFATVGGKYYGASEAGLFRLDGDTDDGEPIDAFVRTGVLNMDSVSHVVKAWIGLTSDGQMVFKTITMDKGRKKENWYRMDRRPAGTPAESRFSPAKGLTGTYWQFELANVDGSYFELDGLKLWPISTGRRYSGR